MMSRCRPSGPTTEYSRGLAPGPAPSAQITCGSVRLGALSYTSWPPGGADTFTITSSKLGAVPISASVAVA